MVTIKNQNDVEVYAHYNIEKAVRIAKRFAATFTSRPVLQNILLESDGTMLATNSHIAIELKCAHSYTERLQLIHKQGIFVKDGVVGNYPNLSDVFDVEVKLWFGLDRDAVSILKEYVNAVKKIAKASKSTHSKVVQLTYDVATELLVFIVYVDATKKSVLHTFSVGVDYLGDIGIVNEKELYIGIDFLYTALSSVAEYGLQEDEVLSLNIKNNRKPIIFASAKAQACVLPITTYH